MGINPSISIFPMKELKNGIENLRLRIIFIDLADITLSILGLNKRWY